MGDIGAGIEICFGIGVTAVVVLIAFACGFGYLLGGV